MWVPRSNPTLVPRISRTSGELSYRGLCAAHDDAAAAAGLPPVDSIDQWAHITGDNATAPRTEVHLSAQALIQGRNKILIGTQDCSDWMGPTFPNKTCHGLVPYKCQPLFPGISPVGLWQHNCGSGGCRLEAML
eukprot:gene10580-biopygen14234